MKLFNNKIFKNKFFIILVCIALTLSIFLSVFSILGVNNVAKNAALKMFSPIISGFSKMGDTLSGYSKYFSGIDKLYEENNTLREENAELRDKLNDATLIEEENRRLREYLEFKSKHENFSFTEALIISDAGSNNSSIVKINKGTNDGLALNMPVVVIDGLVGVISEVGDNWASVRYICASSSGVGAYITRNGETGIAHGDIIYKDMGIVKLKYLSENADVKIGDAVYTSGAGSVYPGGLLIGYVSSVGIDENSRSKIATVTCSVDFSKLRYVMVVTSYTENTEGAENEK